MNLNFENWYFDTQPSNWLISGLCLVLCLFFSFGTWKKTGEKTIVGFWETFRIMIVALFCLTLFDPHRIETIQSEWKPELLFLVDESKSMESLDVKSEQNKLQSRLEFARSVIAHPEVSKLELNATVIRKFFSSEKGKSQTNISAPIKDSINELKNLKAMVILSDGDENSGLSVKNLGADLRNSSIPAFSIFTGSEQALPDLELEKVWAPTFTLKDENLIVGWRIKNSFLETKSSNLILKVKDEIVKRVPVEIEGLSEKSGNISWLSPSVGNFKLELQIEEIEGEAYSHNNMARFDLVVKEEILKVLLIESYPRWEYRFLKNALRRDPGVEVKSLLFHPEISNANGNDYINQFPREKKDLIQYDVVVVGDVGIGNQEITEENCLDLSDLIMNHAGGIVFLPGRRGNQISLEQSPLSKLVPIIYDNEYPRGLGTSNPAQFELTNRGKKHWLTRLRGSGEPDRNFWNMLPGFHWSAVVKESKPGSEVLATHSNFSSKWGKMPLLVIRHFAAGKALFLGTDSAWRWRKGVEDRYHYRFWSQVIRWMGHGRNQASENGIRLLMDPEKPEVGDQVFLRSIVLDRAGFPLEKGNLLGSITHSDGSNQKVTFSSDLESDGIFLSSFVAREPGEVSIQINELTENRQMEAILSVSNKTLEKKGKPIVMNGLSSLAQSTNGKAVHYSEWKKIIPQLQTIIEPRETTRILRLRASFGWGIFLFVLLAVYWTGRKFLGLV